MTLEIANKITDFIIKHKYIQFMIIFIIGLLIPFKLSLVANIVNTSLVLAILAILYQIIFPQIPLKSTKIISYSIALILLTVFLISLQYKKEISTFFIRHISHSDTTILDKDEKKDYNGSK